MESAIGITNAAKLLSVTVKTLQHWEFDGQLIPHARTPADRRLYTEAQLHRNISLKRLEPGRRKVVGYCRVFSPMQKPDLANQRRLLEEFFTARGLADAELNEKVAVKRNCFLAQADAVGRGKVSTLVLALRDRLTRFNFEFFERLTQLHGCEIPVHNQNQLSPEAEIVQNLMTIVHGFSSRLYGLRNYRCQLNEALGQDATAGS